MGIALTRDLAAAPIDPRLTEEPDSGVPQAPYSRPVQPANTETPDDPSVIRLSQTTPESASKTVSTAGSPIPTQAAHGMPVALTAPPSAPNFAHNAVDAELPNSPRPTSERIVEIAELRQQGSSREMNIVLRDETLGRVGVRLSERAGVVQTVIRSDSYQGAKIISGALPALLESLSDRGMPLASQLYGGTGDAPPQRFFDAPPGRGRQSRPETKDGRRAFRPRQIFQLAVR